MPYVITTSEVGITNPHGYNVDTRTTRRAVATLDEAREAATTAYNDLRGTDEEDVEAGIGPDDPVRGKWLDCFDAIQDLPESGGTVGPLPDGTVIEVARWNIGGDWQTQIDAFNAS